jgi:hypothetical protein
MDARLQKIYLGIFNSFIRAASSPQWRLNSALMRLKPKPARKPAHFARQKIAVGH